MSSFPSNRKLRTPISRWSWPRNEVLREKIYKADRPPFGFFPNVTTIINFALCPVAGVFDLFYGIDNALIEPYVEIGVGRIFHQFVSHLKSSLKRKECSCNIEGIKRLYDNFTSREDPEIRDKCWRMYIYRWVDRKLRELIEINQDTKIYFEVHCMTEVKIDGGNCTYPLRGRIDELDMTNKRVIERTILRSEDNNPPVFKDFQVWLYWKLLCNIPKKYRPEPWKNENFKEYDLIVETPNKDFVVEKENPDFCKWVHDAYAWIYDLSSAKASYGILEAFEEASRFCDANNPWDGCKLHHRYCRVKRRRFPIAREAMHRVSRKFYVNLLYEQMWSHHLFMYQLLRLPVDELSKWKILHGKIDKMEGNNIFVTLENPPDPLIEKEEEEEIYDFDVIFGTLRLGLIRRAIKKEVKDRSLHIVVRESEPLPREINVLLPQTSLYKEEPWFLYRLKQRYMRHFERWGLDKESKARNNTLIQFVEAAFGDKRLLTSYRLVDKDEG